MTIEFTEWAREIVEKADVAARRFNPDVTLRLARRAGAVQAVLAEAPEPGDAAIQVGSATLHVEGGLEGLIDIEEPHDRLVLRPLGSEPNVREPH